MKGHVIDIGGNKEKKRGGFKPPLSQVKSWGYLNIDNSTNPDICCSAENIPVEDASYDTAILCEVLEHLEHPEQVLKETFRILKNGGILIMSTPFLFPVHAAPYDFQRWTDTKIRLVLESIGFSDIKIMPIGGIGAVIHDILRVSFRKIRVKYLKSSCFLGLRLTTPFFSLLDRVLKPSEKKITTGYFVISTK
ncbi:MAG: class I SAM-dependent methyltransferase [Nitrospirota bacterium]